MKTQNNTNLLELTPEQFCNATNACSEGREIHAGIVNKFSNITHP